MAKVSYGNSVKTKMSVQPTSTDGDAGWWGDGVWQVVPNVGCGDTEWMVTDRWV